MNAEIQKMNNSIKKLNLLLSTVQMKYQTATAITTHIQYMQRLVKTIEVTNDVNRALKVVTDAGNKGGFFFTKGTRDFIHIVEMDPLDKTLYMGNYYSTNQVPSDNVNDYTWSIPKSQVKDRSNCTVEGVVLDIEKEKLDLLGKTFLERYNYHTLITRDFKSFLPNLDIHESLFDGYIGKARTLGDLAPSDLLEYKWAKSSINSEIKMSLSKVAVKRLLLADYVIIPLPTIGVKKMAIRKKAIRKNIIDVE